MPRNDEYWEERFKLLEQEQNKKGIVALAEIERQYRQAQRELEGKITAWYQRLAKNNNITMREARKLLNSEELAEFKWDVFDYIKYGKENAINGAWVKELENASARAHINRYEALKLQMQQSIEVMFGNQLDTIDSAMRDVYTEGYYRTAYEIQKGVGVGSNMAALDEKQIEKVINKPWAPDGKNFSERVWGNRQKLVHELNTTLTQNIMLGKDPQKAINEISRKMNTSKSVTARLVMTEEAFFSSAAQKDCYEELDVERFKVVATLDSKTSKICQELDGKVFDKKDYAVGTTAPPFHVRCRSTTCPFFEDEFGLVGERAARGANGKVYYVPADMTYKEWKKQCIKDGKADYVDDKTRKQYEKYKTSLEKEAPETLVEFAVEKENKADGYTVNKKQIKGLTYYDKAVSNEPQITSVIESIAKDTGMDVVGLDYRLKTKESFLGKIRRDIAEGATKFEINDIIRYTYTAPPELLVEKMNEAIEKMNTMGYNTVRVKNSWLKKRTPYNGINTIVQAPNGQKFEIQYHTEESFASKNGKMHGLYEKQRVITDKDSAEYLELQDEMFALSSTLQKPKKIEGVKSYG